MRMFPLFARGKQCPRCGGRTERVRTPLLLRPLRWAGRAGSRRRCYRHECAWRGFSLPETASERIVQPSVSLR